MKTTGFIIKIIILFVSLSCFSCINNIKQNESIENFSYPILIDTGELKTQDSILVYTFQNTTAHHNIFYLGKLKDSVKISTFPFIVGTAHSSEDYIYHSYFSSAVIPKYKYYTSTKFKIYIDTTQLLNTIGNYNSVNKSYPAFIYNSSNDTIIIGFGEFVNPIVQIKNNENKWIDLEHPHIYDCGTGLAEIILPPNEYLISSTPIYKGNYKTKMRLKFGDNISNEINCAIPENIINN